MPLLYHLYFISLQYQNNNKIKTKIYESKENAKDNRKNSFNGLPYEATDECFIYDISIYNISSMYGYY